MRFQTLGLKGAGDDDETTRPGDWRLVGVSIGCSSAGVCSLGSPSLSSFCLGKKHAFRIACETCKPVYGDPWSVEEIEHHHSPKRFAKANEDK